MVNWTKRHSAQNKQLKIKSVKYFGATGPGTIRESGEREF